jgi:hypothetical protein
MEIKQMDAILTVFKAYEWVFLLGFGILLITTLYELIAEKE